MTETRIVNRFPATAGLERDLDEIDQATREAAGIITEAEQIVNSPMDSSSVPKLAASGDVAGALQHVIQESGWFTESEIIRPMNDLEKVQNELASLRASTIKALKHLGVDTRKFFS